MTVKRLALVTLLLLASAGGALLWVAVAGVVESDPGGWGADHPSRPDLQLGLAYLGAVLLIAASVGAVLRNWRIWAASGTLALAVLVGWLAIVHPVI